MSRARIALPSQYHSDAGVGTPFRWRLRLFATRVRDLGLRCTGHLPTYPLRRFVYRLVFSLNIAKGARIEAGCVVWGPSRISIGPGAVINRGVVLDGRFPLTIGANASISIQAMILTLEHDLHASDFASVGAAVNIGERAFIGARAIILPGVTVGAGAAVAAGAVVTKNVEAYAVVAGIPAVKIGTRPGNLTYRL